jgi:hypothetical protein
MTLPDAYHDDEPEDRSQPELPSKRSRGVALGLGFFGGVFGLHRFYVGKIGTGIAMLCTFGGLGVWWLYDIVLLATGEFRDADDQPLRNWAVEGPGGRPRRLSGLAERRVEELEEQLDGLQRQFDDLAERVDFAERMLAKRREPPQIPPG